MWSQAVYGVLRHDDVRPHHQRLSPDFHKASQPANLGRPAQSISDGISAASADIPAALGPCSTAPQSICHSARTSGSLSLTSVQLGCRQQDCGPRSCSTIPLHCADTEPAEALHPALCAWLLCLLPVRTCPSLPACPAEPLYPAHAVPHCGRQAHLYQHHSGLRLPRRLHLPPLLQRHGTGTGHLHSAQHPLHQ